MGSVKLRYKMIRKTIDVSVAHVKAREVYVTLEVYRCLQNFILPSFKYYRIFNTRYRFARDFRDVDVLAVVPYIGDVSPWCSIEK